MGRAAENGSGEGDAMPYFAETEFVLTDQNISGVVLQFERGVTVAGRIVPPAGASAGAADRPAWRDARRFIRVARAGRV